MQRSICTAWNIGSGCEKVGEKKREIERKEKARNKGIKKRQRVNSC